MERDAVLHAPFTESHKQERVGEIGGRLCGGEEPDEVGDVVLAPEVEKIKSWLPEREENVVRDTMQGGGRFTIVDKMKDTKRGRGTTPRGCRSPSPR